MKIGIMTFWWSEDNYGQLLQCYALQKYLRDLGHEAYLIRYRPDKDIVQEPLIKKFYKVLNPQKLYNFVKNKFNCKKNETEKKNNERQFELFRQKYIAQSPILYTSLKELQSNPPEADAYIVGSDQVWNFNFFSKNKLNTNVLHAYLLDFGTNKTKRISYAASWGRTEISEDEISEITPLLKRFDYISVREESGIAICDKCGRDDARWVCDPTLLLTSETYRTMYNENNIRKIVNKFLLLYILNECDFDLHAVYDYAEKKNLKVVYVSGNGLLDNYEKFFSTISEWLYLVDNAECVLTNSFHCGVFSTIFHKKFGIVPLTGKLVPMNSRFMSLFELTGTGNRFVSNGRLDILDKEYSTKEIKNISFLKQCSLESA